MQEEQLKGLDEQARRIVEEYLKIGGVVRIKEGRIIYPDKKRIVSQLEQVKKRIEAIKQQQLELNKKKKEYDYKTVLSEMVCFTDPLYWKHLLKMLTDKGYREVFETVEPPVNRVKDPKWRNMIRMFVKSEEYRQRLLEAKTSKLGKHRKTIRETVEKNLEATQELIKHRLEKLEKEKQQLMRKEKALSSMTRLLQT